MGCGCSSDGTVVYPDSESSAGKKAGGIWLPCKDEKLWEILQEYKKSPPTSMKELQDIMSYYMPRPSVSGLRKTLSRYPEGDPDPEKFFLSKTLPVIVENALALKERVAAAFPEGIPLLQADRQTKQGDRKTLRIPRMVVASLLANMFLCSWDWPNSNKYRGMPKNSFEELLRSTKQAECAKLRMVIHYFERLGEHKELRGFMIIDRVFGVSLEQKAWSTSNKPLLPMFLAEQHAGFEETPGLAHADFANMIIGGGVLANGSIQEEIRFAICPELIVSMLVCPRMDEDEAIQIVGAEQFSAYGGYSHSLKFDGDYRDTTYPRAEDGTPLISILAMDALDFRYKDHSLKKQLGTTFALRELNKALAAFTPVDEASLANFPSIATGNWGCGAFKGDAPLKAMLQWAAASQCGRQLRYFPFELTWGPILMDLSKNLVEKGATVGELITCLGKVRERLELKSPARGGFKDGTTLFQAIDQTIEIFPQGAKVKPDAGVTEKPATTATTVVAPKTGDGQFDGVMIPDLF